MLIDELKSIGLSKQEAVVYLACTEIGPSSVLEISRKVGAHRTTVYHTIQGLIEKKLVSESIRGKRRVFVSEGVDGFKNMLKSKLEHVDSIASELIGISRISSLKPIMKFYVGVEAIKDMFRSSVLKINEEVQYGIFTVEEMMSSDDLKNFFLGEYSALRKKHGLFGKLIVADTEGGKQYKSLDKEKFRETKLLPASTYRFPSEVLISSDLVLFFVISPTEQFVISIESPVIATTFKMIFKVLWSQAY